jgi:hypothetical protein
MWDFPSEELDANGSERNRPNDARGNDRGKNRDRSGFPSGMTNKKTKGKGEKQIPPLRYGMTDKKGKSKGV